MNYYLNFTLIGETNRFYILLPWQSIQCIGFSTIDFYLQTLVPEALFEQTRQLKLSQHQPEIDSLDFHAWHRQQKLKDFSGYKQRLASLIGGVVTQVGITNEGISYFIISNPRTRQNLYVSIESEADPNQIEHLRITLQPPDSKPANNLFTASS